MKSGLAFLGAGQMGEPMVYRLLRAGHRVTVFARRSDVRARLRDAGATVVESAAEAVSGQQLVITCFFSDAQLREVMAVPDGALSHIAAGTVVVSHTTGTADTVRQLGATRRDVILVDAPVSGTAEDIADGRLTVMVGGPETAVESAAAVLAAYASTVIRAGDLGSALNLKLVNNVLFAANAQLLSAAVEVARALGIDGDRFLDALAACSADSKAAGFARSVGGMTNFGERAAPYLRKDVAAALTAAQHAGTDLGLIQEVIQRGPLPLAPSSPVC